MEEPFVPMDTGLFNSNGDICVVVDKNHTVAIVKMEVGYNSVFDIIVANSN